MPILPSKTTDFASTAYWDEFFVEEQRKPKAGSFEWYGEFERDLLPLVGKNQKQGAALVLGPGNSSHSQQLFELEFASKVVSVDFSTEAIEMMKRQCARRRYPEGALEWVLGDMTRLPEDYETRFDQVWDKAGLDALMGSEELGKDNGARMIREAFRCLQPGGRFFCVSLLQERVLNVLLDEATSLGFASCVVQPFVPRKDDSSIATFLVTLTKHERGVNAAATTMAPCKFLIRAQEVGTAKDVVRFVSAAQSTFLAKRAIRQEWKPNSLAGEFVIPRVSGGTTDGEARFRFQIVDGSKKNIPFAVLILPQGREHEWAFSQLEGQIGLANAQGIARIIFCTLCRDQEFASMQSVQEELSPLVLEFKPAFASAKNIPFLGIKEELGQRTVLETGQTALNGPYSVEEVVVNDVRLRRLIFMDNPLAVQSEAVIAPGKDGKPDLSKLSFDIHQAMVEFAPQTAEAEETSRVVVCGVGGGGLVSNLALRCRNIESVEIDSVVVQLARKWFGLDSPVFVGDALDYLHRGDGGVDLLFIDINSGADEAESASGLICPPQVFLEREFLLHLQSQVLSKDNGRLVLNFACRSKDKRQEYLARIRAVFPSVVALDMKAWNGEDLNMILCCSSAPPSLKANSEFLDAYRIVNEDGTLQQVPVAGKSGGGGSNKKKKKKSGKA